MSRPSTDPRRRHCCLALVVVLTSGACTLVTSLDGFHGGELPETGEAAPPESGAPDASSDSSDAGPPAAFRCSDHDAAALCTGFDDDAFDPRWGQSVVDVGGSLTREQGAVRSAPYALVATSPASEDAYLEKIFGPLTAARASVECDVMPEQLAADPNATAHLVRFSAAGAGAKYWDIRLIVTATELKLNARTFLDPGVDSHEKILAQPLPLGVWTRVRIEVDFAPQGLATVRAYSDGKRAVDDIVFSTNGYRDDFKLRLGVLPFAGAPWRVRFDDLLVRLE